MSTHGSDPITHRFIGHAMKTHTTVGPGLDEGIYHKELVSSLRADGIQYLSKPKRHLVYRGIVVDTFEPDLVVENHFIPELKCLVGSFTKSHVVQVFCYSKFWNLPTCMLVDFGKQSLFWERLIFNPHHGRLSDQTVPDVVPASLARNIIQAVDICLREIGLGYRQTTWRTLVDTALQLAGHRVQSNPNATVKEKHLTSFPCSIIDETCAVYVTALNDGISATDRAVFQTMLRWLNVDWGIIFHFGKKTADLAFARRPKLQLRNADDPLS